MELQTMIYVLLQSVIVSFVECDKDIKLASVGLFEEAPEYGTYPYKTSEDHYMDPCKACKFVNTFDFFSIFYQQ